MRLPILGLLLGFWTIPVHAGVVHPPSRVAQSATSGIRGQLAAQRSLHVAQFVADTSRIRATSHVSPRIQGAAAGVHVAQGNSPVYTTSYLLSRRALNPARFDFYHPKIGPVVGEIGRLQAGLCPLGQSLINSLLARRALNPTRFDHFHPTLGPLLNQDSQLRAAIDCACPPVNGLLPDTPFYNYLRWRRSINPARFDHYHPRIGPLLAQDQLARNDMTPHCPPTPSIPQIIVPPGSGGTNNGNNPPPPPPPAPPPPLPPPSATGSDVPEPSALILLALGSLAVPGLLRLRRA